MRKNAASQGLLSTHQTARYLGVDMSTVIMWCEQGKIPSFKTPGGHRRIKIADLLTFLKRFNMPVPPDLSRDRTLSCVIVDDEKPIRKLVSRVIRSVVNGITIEEAENGFDAGQKVGELKPDLVILDINLPGLDGFEVCASIRRNPHLRHTRVISISGRTTQETVDRITKAGADVFLPKPLDLSELKNAVRRALSL